MAEPADQIVVEQGSLRVVGTQARERLRARGGAYRLAVDTAGLLVLTAERPGVRPARVLMAGELVTRMSIVEIVNVIASAGWQGELLVLTPDRMRRQLLFDHGALKHAQSTYPEDRLGEVLYRHGALTRGQLDELLREDSPDRRFGQLVVERGLLTQEQLFEYLQKQAEHIFFAMLLTPDGHYVFQIPEDAAAPPPATVHIPIQLLLMEGVQRIDEMALFRERIPTGRLCPEARSSTRPSRVDEITDVVLRHSDGTRSIQEIARVAGLDEFQTTKAVYQLMQQGLVALRSSAELTESATRELVERFNGVLRDVFFAVATYGGLDKAHQTVSAWIQGSGYAPYFGDRLEEDGAVNVDRLVRVVRGAPGGEHVLDAVNQSLHELAAFALFAATTTLPRDQERTLSRDVNRRLKAIRTPE